MTGKKIWSPNSPFGSKDAVFSTREADSLCRRGKARAVRLADAMASLTGLLEPAKWTEKWLREKFVKMGMPKRNGEFVLVFQGEFSQAVMRVAREDLKRAEADLKFDKMVDVSRAPNYDRSRNGIAVWSSKPTLKSKVPGGPSMLVKQMTTVFKKS